MYLRDGGLVWQRTKKIDANHDLVRTHYGVKPLPAEVSRAECPSLALRTGEEV